MRITKIGVSYLALVASWLCLMQPAGLAATSSTVGAQDQESTQSSPASGPRGQVVPILVELFTSGGCARCPEAESVLTRLVHEQPVRGAEIIALREDVESSGSTVQNAPFAYPNFAERQEQYQTLFGGEGDHEPEAVVDGSLPVDGTDGSAIQEAVEKAEHSNKLSLRLTSVKLNGDTISFALAGGSPMPGYVNVYAALVDSAGSHDVPIGEARLSPLQRQTNVEYFGRIGVSWRTKDLGERPFTFQTHLAGASADPLRMRLVVFVQTKHIGPVMGVASCSLSPTGCGSVETGHFAEP
jgi:hypothetical protein